MESQRSITHAPQIMIAYHIMHLYSRSIFYTIMHLIILFAIYFSALTSDLMSDSSLSDVADRLGITELVLCEV